LKNSFCKLELSSNVKHSKFLKPRKPTHKKRDGHINEKQMELLFFRGNYLEETNGITLTSFSGVLFKHHKFSNYSFKKSIISISNAFITQLFIKNLSFKVLKECFEYTY